MSYREVTMDEFYSVVGPQDVHPHITGNYPFTSVYKTRTGREVGRVDTEHRYLLVEEKKAETKCSPTEVGVVPVTVAY